MHGCSEYTERSTLRVLLADDNREVLEHASEMLRHAHEIVGTVVDGDAVCESVEHLYPDLVILDISMGRSNGIEVCRKLRARGFCGGIVFLTVHEELHFVEAALTAGGQGYVIKARMATDLEPAIEAASAHRIFVSPECRK